MVTVRPCRPVDCGNASYAVRVPPGIGLAEWLKREMPRRGYPIEGARAGGLSRLADDAGISRAALSRIMSGQAEPSLDTLRALGRCLGYSNLDMLRFAGIVEPEDLAGSQSGSPDDDVPRIGTDDWWVMNPPADLWNGLDWEKLPRTERWLWHTPNTSPEARYRMAAMARFEREQLVRAEQVDRGEDLNAETSLGRDVNGA